MKEKNYFVELAIPLLLERESVQASKYNIATKETRNADDILANCNSLFN